VKEYILAFLFENIIKSETISIENGAVILVFDPKVPEQKILIEFNYLNTHSSEKK
tara:strand:+ start:99 stop:263 length:165 start_codon:yes stop_codon:yes gene_type:complete